MKIGRSELQMKRKNLIKALGSVYTQHHLSNIALTTSTSQQSYDNMVENFDTLITMLKAEPLYKPNEADIKIAALEKLYAKLYDLNEKVLAPSDTLSNARNARNQLLYGAKTGIHDIGQLVKAYVLSVYNHKSPKHKQVAKIAFTTIKK